MVSTNVLSKAHTTKDKIIMMWIEVWSVEVAIVWAIKVLWKIKKLRKVVHDANINTANVWDLKDEWELIRKDGKSFSDDSISWIADEVKEAIEWTNRNVNVLVWLTESQSRDFFRYSGMLDWFAQFASKFEAKEATMIMKYLNEGNAVNKWADIQKVVYKAPWWATWKAVNNFLDSLSDSNRLIAENYYNEMTRLAHIDKKLT